MSAAGAIRFTVNGKPMQFEGPLSVAELLDRMSLAGKRIALERNGEIVPKSRYGQQSVLEGDTLEIVVAVGGG